MMNCIIIPVKGIFKEYYFLLFLGKLGHIISTVASLNAFILHTSIAGFKFLLFFRIVYFKDSL